MANDTNIVPLARLSLGNIVPVTLPSSRKRSACGDHVFSWMFSGFVGREGFFSDLPICWTENEPDRLHRFSSSFPLPKEALPVLRSKQCKSDRSRNDVALWVVWMLVPIFGSNLAATCVPLVASNFNVFVFIQYLLFPFLLFKISSWSFSGVGSRTSVGCTFDFPFFMLSECLLLSMAFDMMAVWLQMRNWKYERYSENPSFRFVQTVVARHSVAVSNFFPLPHF